MGTDDLEKRLENAQEDKRATFQATHAAIQKNKETLTRLKLENKEIRNTILAMRKERTVAMEQENTKRSGQRKLEEEVNKLRTQFNDLRNLVREKEDLVKAQREVYAELRQGTIEQRDGDAKKMGLTGRNGVDANDSRVRRVRMLENKLEKTLMKLSEAGQFEKTYEQIIKRLKEERVGFDNIIQSVTETLENKQKEMKEIMLVSMESQRARDTARKELQQMESAINAERAVRQKELEERRKFVQAKIEADKRAHERAERRKDMQMAAQGDLSKEEEEGLVQAAAAQPLVETAVETQKAADVKRVTNYEDAFRKIRDATGVADLNEVVMKFLTQEETKKQLQQLTSDAQQKLDKLTSQKNELTQKSEELKYSGSNASNRKLADEFDAKLKKASGELDQALDGSLKLEKMIVELKAGISNLAEKVDGVRVAGFENICGADVAEAQLIDYLGQIENKLAKMVDFVESVTGRPSSQPMTIASGVRDEPSTVDDHLAPHRRSPGPAMATPFMNTLSSDAELPKELAINNVRVDLSEDEYTDDENDMGGDDSDGDSGDEVQGRMDMKVRAAKIADKETRRKKKKEKQGKM